MGRKSRLKKERRALRMEEEQKRMKRTADNLLTELDVVITPDFYRHLWVAKIISVDQRRSTTEFTGADPKSALRNLILDLPKDLQQKKTWQSRGRKKTQFDKDHTIHLWIGEHHIPMVGTETVASLGYEGTCEGVWMGTSMVNVLMKVLEEFDHESFGVRHEWNNCPDLGTPEWDAWEPGERKMRPATWRDPFEDLLLQELNDAIGDLEE